MVDADKDVDDIREEAGVSRIGRNNRGRDDDIPRIVLLVAANFLSDGKVEKDSDVGARDDAQNATATNLRNAG